MLRAARLLWDFGERESGLSILRRVIRDNLLTPTGRRDTSSPWC